MLCKMVYWIESFLSPSAIHSFILDVSDESIKQHFSKEERDEIVSTPGPQVPDISDEINEFLMEFLDKVIINLHAIDKNVSQQVINLLSWCNQHWKIFEKS